MVFGRRQNKNGTLALINSLILIQQDCICNNFDLAFLFSLDNKRGIIPVNIIMRSVNENLVLTMFVITITVFCVVLFLSIYHTFPSVPLPFILTMKMGLFSKSASIRMSLS